MFTLGRFACHNKVRSFALSGCCNKIEFPPHPSSSSRQLLRQTFFSYSLGLTSHSASKQLATLPGIPLSSVRPHTGSFTIWTTHAVGVSRARDRGEETCQKEASCSSFWVRGEISHLFVHRQTEATLQELTENPGCCTDPREQQIIRIPETVVRGFHAWASVLQPGHHGGSPHKCCVPVYKHLPTILMSCVKWHL